MSTTYAQKQVPAQKTPPSNATAVNDLSSFPIAQRVMQKASGVVQRLPADRKFVYYPDISGDDCKNRVPYKPEKICFTPYKGGEVRSAGFNGCYMMAFKFKDPGNTHLSDYFQLLDKDSAPYPLNLKKTYIAHVANDTAREALFDVENRGLLQIERIFRPYRSYERDEPILDRLSLSPNNSIAATGAGSPKIQAGLNKLTGGMELTTGGWVSYVYNQEKFFNAPPPITLWGVIIIGKTETQYDIQTQLL